MTIKLFADTVHTSFANERHDLKIMTVFPTTAVVFCSLLNILVILVKLGFILHFICQSYASNSTLQ